MKLILTYIGAEDIKLDVVYLASTYRPNAPFVNAVLVEDEEVEDGS